MQYIVIAVYDRAIGAYQPTVCVRAIGEAIRNFQDAINDPRNAQIHTHPDDFDLHQVGTFDDATGRLEPLEQPKMLALGKQLTLKATGIQMTMPKGG